jgi:CHRD domain-containing protein
VQTLRRLFVVLMLLGLVATACKKQGTTTSTATPSATAAGSPTPTSSPKASGVEYELDLTGAEEKPGPGDVDGTGKATITLDEANIHEGAKGVAGGIVVTLSAPPDPFKTEGCVTADAAVITRIKTQPTNFYVNIHNTEFPNGAVRGQLPGTNASPAATGGQSPSTTPGGY